MVAIGKHRKRRQCRLVRIFLAISIFVIAVVPAVLLLGMSHDDIPDPAAPLFPTPPHPRFRFLQYAVLPGATPLESDIAELRHCKIHEIEWDEYFAWASHILDTKMSQLRSDPKLNVTDWENMEQEFVLELLEIYATHRGHCRFESLPFAIDHPTLQDAGQKFRDMNENVVEPAYARLAIVFIAFQDAPQLQRLIDAVHMPHHYILIHLERRVSPEFLHDVQEMASQYANVAVATFGTIVYRTDSVSLIQLQLMKWFTTHFSYDYHITLNGAAFPLYSAHELALHLKTQQSHRSVWLGELTHGRNGDRVRSSQGGMLQNKRLVYTRGNKTKGTYRLSNSLVRGVDGAFQITISPEIGEAMSRKTVSGNQGVYSYNIVRKLVASSAVGELFALSKYGCCGVLEERTWIAAMRLIGAGTEALEEAGSVWQAWGGQPTCQSSVNNAILTRNASLCFKVEDATKGVVRNETAALYIRGNEIEAYLKDAKRRGFLFARKFRSDDKESMALLEDIRRDMHEH